MTAQLTGQRVSLLPHRCDTKHPQGRTAWNTQMEQFRIFTFPCWRWCLPGGSSPFPSAGTAQTGFNIVMRVRATKQKVEGMADI